MTKNLKLGIMMFLQYAVWGAWMPVTSRFLTASVMDGGLGFTDSQMAIILGFAASIGALSAPFIAGQVADRYFSTEKILAFLVISGGLVKWYTALQTNFNAWLYLSIIYSVLYMPTLALSNSIAFAHLEDSENNFPKIRAWGTIGWIVATWTFPMIWLQTDLGFSFMPPFLIGSEVEGVVSRLGDSFKFSAIISIIYGFFCLSLPNTPPKKDAVEKFALKKAFKLFKKKSFLIVVISSVSVAIIHQIYFLLTGPFLVSIGIKDSAIGPAMSIGQFSEILIIIFLGFYLKKYGFKAVISLGIFAYCLRYLIFGATFLPAWFIVSSQVLHGVCFAFFFAAVFIYVDKISDDDVRSSAQTLIALFLGGAPILAGTITGYLSNLYSTDGLLNFSQFWLTLSSIGLITTIFFFTQFESEVDQTNE